MYLEHFNLKKKPFGLTPGTDFIWLGEKHKEALATLEYGVVGDLGFLLLTGDVGVGKTALIHLLIKKLNSSIQVAHITDPGLGTNDFFKLLAAELGIDKPFGSKGEFLIILEQFLLQADANHKKVLLIVDEAQRLNNSLLDQIRVLSNIELNDRKLINIFFVGQPEFKNMLLDAPNRAIRQRIAINYQIQPLTESETGQYIEHRLRVAGATRQIFKPTAVGEIFRFTQGHPRAINIICDHALLTAYASGIQSIDANIIEECAGELNIRADADFIKPAVSPPHRIVKPSRPNKPMPPPAPEPRQPTSRGYPILVGIGIVLTAVIGYFFLWTPPHETVPPSAAVNPPAMQVPSAPDAPEQPQTPPRADEARPQPNTDTSEKADKDTGLLAVASEAAPKLSTPTPPKAESIVRDKPTPGAQVPNATIVPAPVESHPASIDNRPAADREPTADDGGPAITAIDQPKPSVSQAEARTADGKDHKPAIPVETVPPQRDVPVADQPTPTLPKRPVAEARPTSGTGQPPGAESRPAIESKGGGTAAATEEAGKTLAALSATPEAPTPSLPEGMKRSPGTTGDAKTTAPKSGGTQPSDAGISATKTAVAPPPAPVEKPTVNKSPGETVPSTPKPSVSSGDSKASAKPAEPVVAATAALQRQESQSPPPPLQKPDKGALENRLRSFLQSYCNAYAAKDIDSFSTFFARDAVENGKPFESLLPKYQKNFTFIESIYYRIELEQFAYEESSQEMIKIDGNFFLRWLPPDKQWRENAGKIYMSLEDNGSTFLVHRLDYHGNRPKE